MPGPRVEALTARLEKGRRKTGEILAGLTAGQWQAPVYPDPSWTVRGLVAHFVSAEERLLELVQNVAAGGPGAPEGFDFDLYNAGEQERLAGESPQELLGALELARQRTIDWVAALGEDQLDLVGRHPGLGQVSLESMITAMYGHQLLHIRDLTARPVA